MGILKTTTNGPISIGLNSFMAKLAVEHGVAKMDYTKKRTVQEWEKLLLEAAGRISEKALKATGDSVGCSGSGFPFLQAEFINRQTLFFRVDGEGSLYSHRVRLHACRACASPFRSGA